ncbi:ABC transporter ATP-binding protein [Clostridium cadaveris]|uniref:ABC transporter ATP-binding protein n=1 Tax=Clostridium cadaveris TaxID=1529 RepID=A0A316MDD0_9CLOT|nr:ABC transporter ATP-binding protein [Clostridium cadaveris]NME64641.1 ABC transporter ATP-binding protein [Clostridium cadaveris]NWK10738.1 ABC transporter ATP-binding protein [Clostridium cadaveris]PWL54553.1 MAG: ABC transporter ATP-binding protein [Clostridium cadaveris]
MSLITCKNTSFAYDGRIVAKNLNFSVESGDYLCIVGENGAGKSTLMKGILQLKSPSSGNIYMGEGLKADEIGYLPQQTEIQKDFPADVFEIVLSGCLNRLKIRPFYGKSEKRLVDEKLEQLGIASLKHHCYRELSGGQQQRVLLARALCATKKILILDEPAAGLDPIVTGELYDLIAKINREQKLTVIMVSHDIQSVLRYSNKVLHLDREQLFFGTVGEYRNTPLSVQFSRGGASHD